jgi:hypothetical protein
VEKGNQFQQIGIFLAYDALIPVLKKLSMSVVPPVIINCIWKIDGKLGQSESAGQNRHEIEGETSSGNMKPSPLRRKE